MGMQFSVTASVLYVEVYSFRPFKVLVVAFPVLAHVRGYAKSVAWASPGLAYMAWALPLYYTRPGQSEYICSAAPAK